MSNFGYTRVSARGQVDSLDPEEARSLGNQADKIRAYAAFKGWTLEPLISDPGESGGTPLAEREGGALLLSLLHPGDNVVVASFDRAFRSALDCLQTCRAWREQGVAFHVLDLQLDTSTPLGEMFLTMAAAFAQYERAMIRQRITEGVRRKIARSGRWGSPNFGTDDPREAEVVRAMANMRKLGLEWTEVAARLNDMIERGEPMHPRHAARWSESTARKAFGTGPIEA